MKTRIPEVDHLIWTTRDDPDSERITCSLLAIDCFLRKVRVGKERFDGRSKRCHGILTAGNIGWFVVR